MPLKYPENKDELLELDLEPVPSHYYREERIDLTELEQRTGATRKAHKLATTLQPALVLIRQSWLQSPKKSLRTKASRGID